MSKWYVRLEVAFEVEAIDRIDAYELAENAMIDLAFELDGFLQPRVQIKSVTERNRRPA